MGGYDNRVAKKLYCKSAKSKEATHISISAPVSGKPTLAYFAIQPPVDPGTT
jgi:hypothetical protein